MRIDAAEAPDNAHAFVVAAATLDYAAQGFPVFPCRETTDKAAGAKAPYLRGPSAPGLHDGGHWLASADPRQVEDWWRRWPRALIGLPTGLRSSSVVIDLDPRETPVRDMAFALRALLGGDLRGPDPETGEFVMPGMAITQSGGLHLYYGYPDPATLEACGCGKVENRANLFRAFLDHAEAPPALAHIDVRAEGGYVVAPPSIMANGARYVWHRKPAVAGPGRFRLPALPQILLEIISGRRRPRGAIAEERRRQTQARRFSGCDITDVRVRRYVERSVAGALDFAARAPEGGRNAAVFWAACRLSPFVRGGFLGRDEAERLLLAHLPAGVNPGEHKILGTIKSGLDNADEPPFTPAQLAGAA